MFQAKEAVKQVASLSLPEFMFQAQGPPSAL
jgi:hypothetical protein